MLKDRSTSSLAMFAHERAPHQETTTELDLPDMPTPEAAKKLGVSEETLRTWRCRKRGPAYYRGLGGNRILYRQRDLQNFIETLRIDPSAEAHQS